MTDNNNLDTVYIRDEITRCDDIEELKSRIFPMLKSQQEQWIKKINQIISENGYTKSGFAQLCGVSRVSVDKWCKGSIPKNRETFLKIGMAANYDLERINQLLQRYGQYPALYSKSLEDCICMFVISNDYGEDSINKYQFILDKMKEHITNGNAGDNQDLSTVRFDEKLSDIRDEDELTQFINDNIATFSYSYHRFYAYVKMCINANYQQNANTSVANMADGQGWSSSLRQCVSAIRQNKWYPTRNKIISLGLHLSMDREQIDEMLHLAYMEPLCAKNLFESVIIFILEDALIWDLLVTDSEDFDPDGLCKHARKILKKMDMPEAAAFISELSEIEDEE